MMLGNVLEKFRLNGKVALITSGTPGIGLATAHAFEHTGAKLSLIAHREQFEGSDALLGAGYYVKFDGADHATRRRAESLAANDL